MGSAFSEGGPGRSLHGFTHRTDDGAEQLVAAVLWRYPAPDYPRPGPVAVARGIVGAIGHLLFHRFRRTPPLPPPQSSWRPPPGWSGSWSDGDGTRAVLYHRGRRVVRVLDQDYPLPDDGRTLVLLVDAVTAPESPRVRVRAAAVPAQASDVLEPPPPPGRRRRAWERAHVDAYRARHDAARAALLADAEVRAFWESPAVRPPAT